MASTCLHTGKARPSTQTREWAAGRRQETGCADSGLELEPRGWLGGCRGRKRTGTPPLPQTHTTRAHSRPRSPLSGPIAMPPVPRSRRYLWGSRPAAASRAEVPLPALPLPLRAPAPPGAGQCRGRGRSGAGGADPGAFCRGKRSGWGFDCPAVSLGAQSEGST